MAQNQTSVAGNEDIIVENNDFKSDLPTESLYGGRRLTDRGNSSVGAYGTATSIRVAQLPEEWDGPYFMDDTQIIPDAPS